MASGLQKCNHSIFKGRDNQNEIFSLARPQLNLARELSKGSGGRNCCQNSIALLLLPIASVASFSYLPLPKWPLPGSSSSLSQLWALSSVLWPCMGCPLFMISSQVITLIQIARLGTQVQECKSFELHSSSPLFIPLSDWY